MTVGDLVGLGLGSLPRPGLRRAASRLLTHETATHGYTHEYPMGICLLRRVKEIGGSMTGRESRASGSQRLVELRARVLAKSGGAATP